MASTLSSLSGVYMYSITKATPINFINSKCNIKFNHSHRVYIILYHVLVINALGERHAHVCTHTRTHIHTQTHTLAHTCTPMHTHTYTHTHTHTHTTHTRMHTSYHTNVRGCGWHLWLKNMNFQKCTTLCLFANWVTINHYL